VTRRLETLRLAVALAIAAAAAPLAAQDGDDGQGLRFVTELIHSDVPLYTFDWEDIWPRSFHADDSFGCESRIAFGDWRFQPDSANEYGSAYWHRIENYGVFHCAANLYTADERDELTDGEFERGFFVKIGEGSTASEKWELWVLQHGMIPGSSYTLLARAAGKHGMIENFRVLQRQCPRANMRAATGFDVWSTGYCAINSRSELIALAHKMLQLPPLGVLERVGDTKRRREAPDNEPDAPED
jgi:hypothetical protein